MSEERFWNAVGVVYIPSMCASLFLAAIVCGIIPDVARPAIFIAWLGFAWPAFQAYIKTKRTGLPRTLVVASIAGWICFFVVQVLPIRLEDLALQNAKLALFSASPIILFVDLLRSGFAKWIKIVCSVLLAPWVALGLFFVVCFTIGAMLGSILMPAYVSTIPVGKHKIVTIVRHGWNAQPGPDIYAATDLAPGIQWAEATIGDDPKAVDDDTVEYTIDMGHGPHKERYVFKKWLW
jgi:hypothetical protein